MSPDRLKVNPIESAVVLVNEIFNRQSEKFIRALNPSYPQSVIDFERQYSPEVHSLQPETFMQDVEKSKLLIDAVNRVLETLKVQEKLALRVRFGLYDGQLHTYSEVTKELSPLSNRPPELPLTTERARQVINKGLQKLRHPYRSKFLRGFLPPLDQ